MLTENQELLKQLLREGCGIALQSGSEQVRNLQHPVSQRRHPVRATNGVLKHGEGVPDADDDKLGDHLANAPPCPVACQRLPRLTTGESLKRERESHARARTARPGEGRFRSVQQPERGRARGPAFARGARSAAAARYDRRHEFVPHHPGRRIRSYLDVLAPDDADVEELRRAIAQLHGVVTSGIARPWVYICGRCEVTFLVEPSLDKVWRAELHLLWNEAEQLWRDPNYVTAPPDRAG
jgi:hypothetical protein